MGFFYTFYWYKENSFILSFWEKRKILPMPHYHFSNVFSPIIQKSAMISIIYILEVI